MKKSVYIFFSLFSLLVAPAHLIAETGAETVTFGTFPIPLMVEDANKGVFVELVKTIAERGGFKVEIIVAPAKRTLANFQNNKLDAIFPALDVNFPSGQEPLKSKEIIYIKRDFIFTKKGGPILKNLSELKGKKAGITLGYPYVDDLMHNNSINLEVFRSDEVNAKQLLVGRIDAFVVEEKSGLKAFKNIGADAEFQYDPKTPMSEQDVYFAFHKNPTGEKYEAIVSKVLAEMKQDGSFAEIMRKAE